MTNTEYHIKSVKQILYEYCTSRNLDTASLEEKGTQETSNDIRTSYCTQEGQEFHIVYNVPKQSYTVETF